MPKIIYSDPDSGQDVTVELNDDLPEITIGRNPGNIVRVNNPSISRRHAKLVLESSEVTLYDLDSSNGSYVNGNRIKSQVLVDGDRVRVGEFPLDYVDPTDSATAEVDADMIESVLESEQTNAARQTRLGGFEAEEMESETGPPPQQQWGQQPSNPQQQQVWGEQKNDPLTLEDAPTFDAYDAGAGASEHWGEPGSGPFDQAAQNPYEMPPSSDVHSGQQMGQQMGQQLDESTGAQADDAFGQPQSGFGQQNNFGQAATQNEDPLDFTYDDYVDEDAQTGIGDAGYAFRQAAAIADANDADEDFIVDEDDIEELSDIDALAESSQGEDDVVTYNAPPEEIAMGLRAFDRVSGAHDDGNFEATVEDDITRSASLYGPKDPSGEASITEFDRRIAELTDERDELLDILQNRAADVGGSVSTQLDRLRSERDRLIDERKSTQRQLADLHQRLEAAPKADELQHLQSELAQTLSARDDLQEELETLRLQLQQQTEGEAGLQDELARANEQVEELQRQLEQRDSAQSELSEARDELDGELEAVQAALEAAEERASDAEDQVDNLEAQLQQLRSTSTAAEGDIAEKVAEIGSLEGRLRDTEEALSDSNARIEDLRAVLQDEVAEKDALEGQLAEVQAELDARPRSDDLEGIAKELTEVRTELQQVVADRDRLTQHEAELEEELASTRQLLDDVQTRYDKVGAEFDSVVRERDTLKQEKGAFARETDYLQTERRQLVEEVENLRKKVKAAEKDTKKKKQIFADLSKELRKLVSENEKLEKELDDLRAAMVDAPDADDMETLEARVEELEAELAARNEAADELESDSRELTRELGKIADERDELAIKLEAANEEIVQLQEAAQESSSAAEKLEAVEEAKAGLEERATTAESRVEELETELEELRASSESAEGEAEEKGAQVAELEAKLQELEAKLEEVDPELAEKVAGLEEKLSEAEGTLAEIILERDRLEDELRKAKA